VKKSVAGKEPLAVDRDEK